MDTFITNASVTAAVISIAAALTGIGVWIAGVNGLKPAVKQIQEDLKKIQDDIKRIFHALPPNPVTSGSPLRLTELGARISSDLNAAEWAKRTAQRLADQVEGKEPYEVQEFCYAYMGMLSLNEERQAPITEADIKRCAYENGMKESQVKEVLVVELRDALLALAN